MRLLLNRILTFFQDFFTKNIEKKGCVVSGFSKILFKNQKSNPVKPAYYTNVCLSLGSVMLVVNITTKI